MEMNSMIVINMEGILNQLHQSGIDVSITDGKIVDIKNSNADNQVDSHETGGEITEACIMTRDLDITYTKKDNIGTLYIENNNGEYVTYQFCLAK